MPTSTHRRSPIDDELNTSMEEKIDNMSNFNHMSGSYSNLFRDRLDDEQFDSAQNAGTQIQTSRESLANVSNKVVENVYCNIPPQFLPPADGQSCSEYSNPNQHVYSNISTSAGAQDGAAALAIASPLNKQTVTVGNSNRFSSDHLAKQSETIALGSSTLLNDDLDLDDPVMAVGVIRTGKVHKKTLNQKADGSSSSTTNTKAPISMEMKQVSDAISAKGDRQNMNSTAVTGSKSNDTSISSSRMLLHDTTMIDTALDLDSLDGSSLDNSQACLVNKKSVV